MAKPSKRSSRNSSSLSSSGDRRNNNDGNRKKKVAKENGWKDLDQPKTSLVDRNQYRQIQLKNGIKVLLVDASAAADSSEQHWTISYNPAFEEKTVFGKPATRFVDTLPSTLPSRVPNFLVNLPPNKANVAAKGRPASKCLVSLEIAAGSHDDPVDFPGLAHLCEHIVHHGSVRFPSEEGYHQFVNENGGTSNAFTSKTATNYHFCVKQKETFEGAIRAMEMLADMLAHPLIPLEAVRREIESVDNEFYMRKTCTFFQQNYLTQNLTVDDPKHPLRVFSIGNKAKLMPRQDPERLQAALKLFQQQHYYGENMSLVIKCSLPLDDLEDHVARIFNEIPAKPSSKSSRQNPYILNPSQQKISTPYNMKKFNKLITLRPCEEMHRVDLQWVFPKDTYDDYDTKPLSYIGALLKYAGPGGLYSYLAKKNWAYLLTAFCPYSNNELWNKYAKSMQLIILLTSKGRKELNDVLLAIFSYLKFVGKFGIDDKIYKQLQALEETKYKYLQPHYSMDRIIKLSGAMKICEEDDEILFGERRFFDFDDKLIKKCLSQMNPRCTNYFVMSQDGGPVGFPCFEEMYGGRYKVSDLPPQLLKNLENVQIYRDFKVPDWSNAIPKEQIRLHVLETPAPNEDPEALVGDPHLTICYKPIGGMLSPQINIHIGLGVPFDFKPYVTNGSLKIYIHLLDFAISDAISDWGYLGSQVKLGYDEENNRMVILVKGLRYRINDLLDVIFTKVVNFSKEITRERFDLIKEIIEKSMSNQLLDSFQLAEEMLRRLKFKSYCTSLEQSQVMKKLTFDEFSKFPTEFLKCVKIEGILTGNLSRAEAVEICEFISEKQYFGWFLSEDVPGYKRSRSSIPGDEKIFPVGDKCIRVKSLNNESRMSTIINYYALSRNNEETLKIGMFLKDLVESAAFHELRTMQQLGYRVQCELIQSDQLGLVVAVSTQADKFCPCDIDGRIDRFLLSMYEKLVNAPDNITHHVLRSRGIYKTPVNIRDYYRETLISNAQNPQARKISVQVVACCGENACLKKAKLEADLCKKQMWLTLIGQTIKLRGLTFAIDNEDETVTDIKACPSDKGDSSGRSRRGRNRRENVAKKQYFIWNIDQFHEMCSSYFD